MFWWWWWWWFFLSYYFYFLSQVIFFRSCWFCFCILLQLHGMLYMQFLIMFSCRPNKLKFNNHKTSLKKLTPYMLKLFFPLLSGQQNNTSDFIQNYDNLKENVRLASSCDWQNVDVSHFQGNFIFYSWYCFLFYSYKYCSCLSHFYSCQYLSLLLLFHILSLYVKINLFNWYCIQLSICHESLKKLKNFMIIFTFCMTLAKWYLCVCIH